MKKFFLLLTTGLAFFTLQICEADSVIANWTFENDYLSDSVTGTNSPFLATDSGAIGGLAWGHHQIESSFLYAAGNDSSNSLDAKEWSIGDYFEFQTSTLDFANISISFDQYRSSNGPVDWDFEYSIDGSQFTKKLNYSMTDSSSWITIPIDLSSIPILANETNVYFRLVADSPPGQGGAVRIDNFTVSGIPVPEPSVAVLTLVLLCGMAAVKFRRRKF